MEIGLLVPSSARPPDEVSNKYFLLRSDIPHTSKALIKSYKIACRALSEEKIVNRSYKWKGGTEQGRYLLITKYWNTCCWYHYFFLAHQFLSLGEACFVWTGHQGCDVPFVGHLTGGDPKTGTASPHQSRERGNHTGELLTFLIAFFPLGCQDSWFLFDTADQEIKDGSFIGYAFRENSVKIN